MAEKSVADPLRRAVGLLARREHSQRELRRKLSQRGADEIAVDQALERLQQTGLQDDGRFAASLIRQRVAAGYGPLHLRAELHTHGLEAAMIEQLLAAAELDWTEQACALLQRRFPAGCADIAEQRRAFALLQRRGFAADSIRAALDDARGRSVC